MTVKLALASVPIFQFVPPEAMRRLSGVARVVEKARGEAVVLHDEPVLGIYVVGEGNVAVFPPSTSGALARLGVGESFGEMSFLEKAKASATIRADGGPARLVLFPAGELTAAAEADPQLGRCLYQGIALALSRKLRATTDKIAYELEQGRELLEAVGHVDTRGHEVLDAGAGASDVGAQSKQLVVALDDCSRILEDVVRKLPEKAGTLQELDLKLSAARSRYAKLFPLLQAQSKAVAQFADRLAAFVAASRSG